MTPPNEQQHENHVMHDYSVLRASRKSSSCLSWLNMLHSHYAMCAGEER